MLAYSLPLLALFAAPVLGDAPVPGTACDSSLGFQSQCNPANTVQLVCEQGKWWKFDCAEKCTDGSCNAIADKWQEQQLQAILNKNKPKDKDKDKDKPKDKLVRRGVELERRKEEEEEEEEEETDGGSPLVTFAQFKAAVKAAGYPCPGAAKYKAFVKVAAKEGNIKCKRELAMFLTQVLWESDGLRAKEEYKCKQDGCAKDYRHPKLDKAGKKYFGRGYIQLTWSYNYKACSQDLYKDDRLLKRPGSVARSEELSWATAAWFWKKNVHKVTKCGKFGLTTKAINGGLECGKGPNVKKAKIRYQKYKLVFKAFGLPGKPLEGGCYN